MSPDPTLTVTAVRPVTALQPALSRVYLVEPAFQNWEGACIANLVVKLIDWPEPADRRLLFFCCCWFFTHFHKTGGRGRAQSEGSSCDWNFTRAELAVRDTESRRFCQSAQQETRVLTFGFQNKVPSSSRSSSFPSSASSLGLNGSWHWKPCITVTLLFNSFTSWKTKLSEQIQ